jgi:hypothetical protein
MGTCKEQDGNREKKKKKKLSQERKQPDPLLVHAEPFIDSNY